MREIVDNLDGTPQMSELHRANYEAIAAKTNEQADRLIGLYFPVFDHGFVSLVDYCGGDFSVVRSARTSYQHGVSVRSNDRNLIRYLLKHDHGTPFEFVNFTFHCQMPIFVARQWIRHRVGSFNEMSGRYSVMPLMFYTPKDEDIQAQSSYNKQGRDGAVSDSSIYTFKDDSSRVRLEATEMYRSALQGGITRELSRIDLPLSTYTNWYWNINLRSLMNFLRLRCDSHAQYEIRAYANIIAGMVKEVCPLAFEAWQDYTFESEHFSYQEMLALYEIGNEALDFGSCTDWSETLNGIESSPDFDKYGLSKREATEFKAKILKFREAKKQDFTLDLSQAKTPAYFQEQAKLYVPLIPELE